jgi:hypothetical protein
MFDLGKTNDLGPKGQPFAQPRVAPWGTERPSFFILRSAQRAKSSLHREENNWPVGPEKNRRFPRSQGVALGWANGWAFGPTEHLIQ